MDIPLNMDLLAAGDYEAVKKDLEEAMMPAQGPGMHQGCGGIRSGAAAVGRRGGYCPKERCELLDGFNCHEPESA